MTRSRRPAFPPAPAGASPSGSRRRGPSKLVVGAAVFALVSGAWLLRTGTQTHEPPMPSPADALAGRNAAGPGSSSVPAPGPAALPASPPTRVSIPAIRVDAPLMPLGVDAKNEIQVPPAGDRNLAGWYKYGAMPGTRGAAVLLGHVDTLKGPAVFYNLGSLHKGNTIQIARADGRTAVYTIYGVEVYAKADFPTDRVYADTPAPELRVITCGGGFSKARHTYLGNVVVYAKLTGSKATPAAGKATPATPPAAGKTTPATPTAPGKGSEATSPAAGKASAPGPARASAPASAVASGFSSVPVPTAASRSARPSA